MPQHIPVLAAEVINGLELKPGHTVIDGTLGLGGHAELILQATAPNGRLIGIDRDQRNLDLAKLRLKDFGSRVEYVHGSFATMAQLGYKVDSVVLDLGFSSVHVDDPERGFSFQTDGPLDMRYDTTAGQTAADLVNSWLQEGLATIFRKYGEEPQARQIARAIVSTRKLTKFTSTIQLADVIEAVSPRRGRLHPATKVFQALRIAVNNELGELERGLAALEQTLKPGGMAAIITFYSLEDRLVKNHFKTSTALEPVTKKPITATQIEITTNPRSRSAKLRLARRV